MLRPALALLPSFVAIVGCGTIETTASVAKVGASVVGTTVSAGATVAKTTAELGLKTASTAATVGGVALTAGSAAVSAGAAAKTATVATYGVAIAGASAVGGTVKWGVENSRSDDLEFAQVVADGSNRFLSKEGARIVTSGCDESKANEPALLVVNRSGEYTVRTVRSTTNADADARRCPVVSIQNNDTKP
jgi:hypothetical protein